MQAESDRGASPGVRPRQKQQQKNCMAKKKTASKLTLSSAAIESINAALADLLTQHAEEIETNIEESDSRVVTVNCAIKLDASESAPSIDLGLRFSSSVTDKRTIRCDDPNQMTFTTLTQKELEEEKLGAKKEAKKNKKGAEDKANAGDGKGSDSEPAE